MSYSRQFCFTFLTIGPNFTKSYLFFVVIMANTFNSKYKVLQSIGEGSFSEVVKCEDKSSGLCYAAKRLKKVFRSEKHAMTCAEIVAMKKLSWHPNVVQMLEYHYDSEFGKLTFVFELMDMSMYDFMKLKKRGIPEIKAKNYLYQILKGLDHLHKNGLFHRDVKPENVLIKLPNLTLPFRGHSQLQYETVKLADLGSIRGIFSSQPYTEYISTRWYRSPECLLTIGYYGPKMDVWATGCVFYEILTLKPLFAGSNEIDQLSKIHAILGTPNQRLLNKLKAKSKNCKCFPKQTGSGIHNLLVNLSDCGLAVLKMMVQYDPDQRVNIKRLLEHKYFSEFKEQDLIDKYSVQMRRRNVTIRNKGDFGTTPALQSFSKEDKPKFKLSKSPDTTPRKTNFPIVPSSRTTVELSDYYRPVKSKHHVLNKDIIPMVNHNQMKAWGVNPNMLKAPPELGRKNPYHPEQLQVKQRKKRTGAAGAAAPQKDYFRKTTSNIPQFVRHKESPQNAQGKAQFRSKSFVLPWRKAGLTNLETIFRIAGLEGQKR